MRFKYLIGFGLCDRDPSVVVSRGFESLVRQFRLFGKRLFGRRVFVCFSYFFPGYIRLRYVRVETYEREEDVCVRVNCKESLSSLEFTIRPAIFLSFASLIVSKHACLVPQKWTSVKAALAVSTCYIPPKIDNPANGKKKKIQDARKNPRTIEKYPLAIYRKKKRINKKQTNEK